MTKDLSHLDALRTRLKKEKDRLAAATKPAEIKMRKVWVDQVQKEIDQEYMFLGIEPMNEDLEEMSDDELLAELNGL